MMDAGMKDAGGRRTWGEARCVKCDIVHAVTDICPRDAENIEQILRGLDPFEVALSDIVDEVCKLVVSKQRDYGHDNITRHGLIGLDVRIADKQARLHNLVCVNNGHDVANETLRDTFLDLAGYGMLGVMVLDGVFELPLKEDKNEISK